MTKMQKSGLYGQLQSGGKVSYAPSAVLPWQFSVQLPWYSSRVDCSMQPLAIVRLCPGLPTPRSLPARFLL